MKKIISLIMALTLFISVINTGFAVFAASSPYIDDEGYYHRIVDGVDTAFDTDYEKVVNSVRTAFKNRESRLEFRFATSDPAFAYIYNDSQNTSGEAAQKLWERVFRDALTTKTLGEENAGNGDYLFKTIERIGSYGNTAYLNSGDAPSEGNVRYYPFYFKAEGISYLGSSEWDEKVNEFARAFGEQYLNPNTHPNMTEYEKVKTIYDFIVRNTEYDNAVFHDEYDKTTERYKIAHSAYGAIYGNLLKDSDPTSTAGGESKYYLTPKTVASGEQIIDAYNQGLAVCEGYSLLFYYLCTYNGIDCHIVDGEYSDGREFKDPHEWNYVYLDDETGDGRQWYQVDTTFASEKSYKEVDINNYDYFLRGTTNYNFGTIDNHQNHQQPYHNGLDPLFDTAYAGAMPQLYTWNTEECYPSQRDYRFKKADISRVDDVQQSVIFKRATDYGGERGVVSSYIYSGNSALKKIELSVEENGEKTVDYLDVEGFIYNGHTCDFTVMLAYLVPDNGDGNMEYSAESLTAKDVKRDSNGNVLSYSIDVYGSGNTAYKPEFKILPLDMSNLANYSKIEMSHSATYRGEDLYPEELVVYDGYDNLSELKDFDIKYVADNGTVYDHPKEIGNYTVNIIFKGNHSGVYKTDFEVEKIKMSNLNMPDPVSLPYFPASVLKANGITGAHYYIKSYSPYNVKLVEGVDFTASSTGSMDYNATANPSGQIILTGIESAASRTFGGSQYSRRIGYIINQKYDIKQLGMTIADNSAKYFYTGAEIKPTSFNHLDSVLVRGKDYKIKSYSNNVNAGTAYVTVEGINGCEGELKLEYRIYPASLTGVTADVTVTNGVPYFKLTYGGKTLKNGTDYTVSSPVKSGSTATYTISGKGNFSGTKTINIVTQGSSASSSGTSSSLPSGTTTVTKKTSSTVSKPESAILKTRVNLKSVKKGKKSITVKWAKQSGTIHGYYVEYSLKKNFKGAKTKTVKGASKTKLTIKKLKKKKKYYVRVRSFYKKGNNIYCSAWSVTKSAKTK